MMTDTVAKLLWEHDQPHLASYWDLGPGVTVIVDEAGMLATGDLHRLAELADQHDWRLALVGDPRPAPSRHPRRDVRRAVRHRPHCRTRHDPPVHQPLGSQRLPAAPSRQPRRPPRVRVPRPHPARMARRTPRHHRHHLAPTPARHVAITTTTNEHVQAINNTIQRARIDRGDLDPARYDRHRRRAACTSVTSSSPDATTDDCAPRPATSCATADYWNVTALPPRRRPRRHPRRRTGDTSPCRPATSTEHVQLGYAATEPGNQSDTTNTSITLATAATTCRGLYVGVTRGRDENIILRRHRHPPTPRCARRPRTHPRHRPRRHPCHHPTTPTRQPPPHEPAARLEPRCRIPDWFDSLHRDARTSLHEAQHTYDEQRRAFAELRQILDENQGRTGTTRAALRATRPRHRSRQTRRGRTTRPTTRRQTGPRHDRVHRPQTRPATPRRHRDSTCRRRTTPRPPPTRRPTTPRPTRHRPPVHPASQPRLRHPTNTPPLDRRTTRPRPRHRHHQRPRHLESVGSRLTNTGRRPPRCRPDARPQQQSRPSRPRHATGRLDRTTPPHRDPATRNPGPNGRALRHRLRDRSLTERSGVRRARRSQDCSTGLPVSSAAAASAASAC